MRAKLLAICLPLVLFVGLAAAQPNVWHVVNGVLHGPGFVTTGPVTIGGAITTDGPITMGTVSVSNGAANRLDLATGDSFYMVSGGLGVGTTPPSAGSIQASGAIVAGSASLFQLAGRSFWSSSADGLATFSDNDTTGSFTLSFNNNPTCATNCGTSPTLDGVDSSFTLTMGATGVPASGFVVTFNGTWAAAPQCTGAMAKAGMVVGKLPLTLVTTTTTLTVVTNGTAPATTDMYHFICSLGQ